MKSLRGAVVFCHFGAVFPLKNEGQIMTTRKHVSQINTGRDVVFPGHYPLVMVEQLVKLW